MNIAILSDFHIGYERFREDAFRQASEAMEIASREADVIVIAGDIFDYRHPKPEVIVEAVSLFKKISSQKFTARVVGFEGRGNCYTEVPIIAIPGTHERRTADETDSIDLLNLAGYLVNANQARVTVEKEGERVSVFGIGGVSEERFKETINQIKPQPSAGAFNLFLFHQSVYEFLPFGENIIKLEELPKGFDLYVDGHIHSKVESKCHGKMFLIPGSTVLTQLKEGEQEEKGFFIYNTETNTYFFRKINSRKFVMLKIDVADLTPSEIKSRVEEQILKIPTRSKEKPIIRVVLEGKLKEGFKNIDLGLKGILDSHSENAIIEITKSGIESYESKETEELRNGMLENVSIRDYGVGLFLKKLSENKYNLNVNPSLLFDLLASEEKKETAINRIMGILFLSS